ncbi:hypothetical protein D3C72_512170 [compost metagenome]
MGVFPHRRGRQADPLNDFEDPPTALLRLFHPVILQHPFENAVYVVLGIQRAVRVLEHHLHEGPVRAQLLFIEPGDIAAIEQDLAGAGTNQPENGFAQRRFAASGLTDQAKGFARADLKRHVIHGSDQALAGLVVGAQVAHVENRLFSLIRQGVASREVARMIVQVELDHAVRARAHIDFRQRGTGVVRTAVEAQRSPKQAFGVRVLRRGENRLGAAGFNDQTVVHHRHPVGPLPHDPKVMGNQQQPHGVLFAQLLEQLQDVRLYRDVQRGGRFIGDQQPRVAGHGNRDHHPLALATGKVVRIVIQARRRIGNAHFLQQGQRLGTGVLARQAAMPTQYFADLLADA